MRYRIRRRPVTSSAIAAIGYSAVSETLEVEFLRGAVYEFYGVPKRAYEEFVKANSKGSFFNARVRFSFDYERSQ